MWRTRELADTLGWIRARNIAHPDERVRVFGLNADRTHRRVYEATKACLRASAPLVYDEASSDLELLMPKGAIAEHVSMYRSSPDQGRFLDAARRVARLVDGLEPTGETALAQRHARAILDFYEYHSRAPADVLAYSAPRMAQNIMWWRQRTGTKIVYWGGIAHTLAAEMRSLSRPPLTQTSTGGHLRRHLGDRYVSVGLTFSRGLLPQRVPDADERFAEALLGTADADAYCLLLKPAQPPEVRSWFDAPTRLRLVGPDHSPQNDAASFVSGGSLNEWFDVLVHTRDVREVRRQPSPEPGASPSCGKLGDTE